MTKKTSRPPKLPQLLDRKIYKTGQTRGADDDVIYQNRVSRTSTVLIPYGIWDQVNAPPEGETSFENGFIALLTPSEYFNNSHADQELTSKGLRLGENALVFYQKRMDWEANNPENKGWIAANSRISPLNGEYVARVAATTAFDNGGKISRGYNTTGMKGAGIRLFEYASKKAIDECRIQLETIFWLCYDSMQAVTEFGMKQQDAIIRKKHCLDIAQDVGMLDMKSLAKVRMTDENGQTICPLCLKPLSGFGFFSRLAQALGREVHDLTVTEINLFHIQELRYGEFNHRPYNLGWGHHHCNVVVKDSGINETIKWMDDVIQRNIDQGYYSS
jgi:hypothetical protein